MAYVNLQAVMEGVAERLRTIPGLRVTAYMPDQVNPPHAVVRVPEVTNYHLTMGRGSVDLNVVVNVFVPGVDDRTGQIALSEYAQPGGEKSVLLAIEGDKRLGGAVSDCVVVSFRPFDRQQIPDSGGAICFVGEFTLRVIAPGK
jgi:hypothetical protein